jgi:hypothetical protein
MDTTDMVMTIRGRTMFITSPTVNFQEEIPEKGFSAIDLYGMGGAGAYSWFVEQLYQSEFEWAAGESVHQAYAAIKRSSQSK